MELSYDELSYDETEEEIPFFAESPDLIHALLDFEAGELSGPSDELPEDMLVRKACELRKWRFEGTHPRFLVDSWIEVVVTGRHQGFCRILNSRTHIALKPFTLSCLIDEVEKLQAWLAAYQTEPGFEDRMIKAYEIVTESIGSDVPLLDVYRVLNGRQPQYRRECFGLDLGRSLMRLPAFKGRRAYLSYSGGPSTGRYALCVKRGKSAQVADQIRIDPDPLANQMVSLDI